MLKIKDIANTNEVITIALVVLNATARETKAKKPYLQLELFDGFETINGNYWDWVSGKVPEINTILNVTAQVSTWMGTKQLNIKALNINNEMQISDFAPESGYNIDEIYDEALKATEEVSDTFLQSLAKALLTTLSSKWKKIPGAKQVHHAFVGGTLVHSLSVAKIAKAISSAIPQSNDDLCFVGGLLHDLGKLYSYKLNGISIDMTITGQLYDHTFMGAEFVGNFVDNNFFDMDEQDEQKVRLLRHIILSHHGELEYGAAVPPQCIEAHIVHSADNIDASVQQVIEHSRKVGEAMWTDRIYTLGNKPHLTPRYVEAIFSKEKIESSSAVS